MDRRQFIAAIGASAFAVPLRADAQRTSGQVRIATFMFGSPEGSGHLVEAFKRGLAEAGYVEGRNLRIESRWAMGNSEKLAEITKELIALKPDVVLVGTVAVARALLEKTTTTPIIGVAVDLLGTGLVNNLARPGGNLTGLSSLTVDTTAKLIELHRLISPSLSKLAVLTNSI